MKRTIGLTAASVLLIGCQGTLAPTVDAQTIATVSVNSSASTTSVAPSFLGLSMVLSETSYMAGTRSVTNPIFLQLVKNLTAKANGPMEIRELSDEAFTTTTTTDNLPALSSFYSAMTSQSTYGVKYFVGVDFADDFDSNDNDNGTAASQALTIYNALPTGSLLSYEVGNEPDLYPSTGKRSSSYSYTQYQSEYEKAVAAIEAKGTNIAMDAPVFSGFNNSFASNINAFITAEQAHLGLFDLHYYGGSDCNGKTVAADYLMKSAAVNYSNDVSQPSNVSGYIKTLNGVGRSNFRIGEMNSIACQGQSGVSDTFQSALWFLDEVMSYAAQGVSGINLFTINATSYYSPFQFSYSGTSPNYTYSVKKINPIYYGMMMESFMLQSNAAVLPVTLTTSLNVKAYATKDSSGNVRILILNKEEGTSGDGTVSISMSGGGTASLWQLQVTGNNYNASDYTSITSSGDTITLAGQTFKGSTDGTIQGTQSLPSVTPSSGVYKVTVPHCSAVIVKIPTS